MLVSCIGAMAQMSDEQVAAYAKQRQAAGASTQVIGSELMERGVSREQLQRIYSSLNGKNAVAASEVQPLSRLRVTNGETEPDNLALYQDISLAIDSLTPKIFGHDIFRSKNLSFEPNMNLAIAQDYVLGPGDELIVDVYGNSQASDMYKVAPDGTVTIPRLGPVGVAGLTVEAAQKRIASALGSHYDNSAIKLSVGQTRTITINVMGEVVTPGTYTLSAFATVFHALYMAGGINSIGTLRNIQVMRKGKTISVTDVYEYILNGRLAGNVRLQDNDVVIVGPYNNLVNISGKVRRPMWYEMKKSESLADLIRFSGNFAGNAYRQSVRVERTAGERKTVYTVKEADFANFILTDEDSVFVKDNENRYQNSVMVQGAVKFPGNYEQSKATTFRSLIDLAGGLTDDAQTNRAVLIRTKSDLTKEALSIDIEAVLQGRAADVPLQNEDVVTIASLAQRNKERNIIVDGEVYAPDTLEYAEGLSIEDAITLAGGLRESASLLNVEVARRIIDPSAPKDLPVRSELFTFSLKDGMPVGAGDGFTLKPYDHVSIRRSPVFTEQQSVSISGEIMFAGSYVLENENTRISEIIKRAGGFKGKACIENARLLRTMDEAELARRKQKLDMAASAADSISFSPSELSTQYSVGINLAKAIEKPESDFDIVLRNGDQIIVPPFNATVKISGEVLFPNTVTYVKGKTKDYYISAAGGYTKESIRRRAYIIYANGEVTKLSKGKIEPGCEIVVPQKTHRDNSATTMRWVSISTSVISTLAVIANLLK